MPLLKWRPEYTVNAAELDCHHKKLFDTLNSAYENIMNSDEILSIISVIDDLSEYMKYHFAAEEKHMAEKGYQDIDAHISEHRLFAANIEKLKSDHLDNNLEATKELIIVLGNWVLHHILMEDKKYSDLLRHEELKKTEE